MRTIWQDFHLVLSTPAGGNHTGCRILINALLIHVASNLETDKSGVVIAPESRIEEMVLGCTENLFGGVVDYILFFGDKVVQGQYVSRLPDLVFNFTYVDRIIKSETLALSDPEIYKLLECNIYEAKPKELFTLTTSLPQVAMAAIIKAQHLQ